MSNKKKATANPLKEKSNSPKKLKSDEPLQLFYYGKGVALFGNTKPHKEILGKEGLRGTYNRYLKHPVTGKRKPGWIFTARLKKTEEIEEQFNIKITPRQQKDEQQDAD